MKTKEIKDHETRVELAREDIKIDLEKDGEKIVGGCEGDTGSLEVQVEMITERINFINEHLKTDKKDNRAHRGLTLMVGKRRVLLNSLKERDFERYKVLINRLNLRK